MRKIYPVLFAVLLALPFVTAKADAQVAVGIGVGPAVVAAPVVVAPVAVAPVYVPTCNFVAVPVVNAYTGWTTMVTRRVCN